MAPAEHPLEPGAAEMRALGQSALDLLERFVESRPLAPAADLDGAYELAARIRASGPPEEGLPSGEALATIERAAAKAIDTAGPGYFAYIPGGGLVTSAVGDLLAGGLNRFVNLAAIAPAMTAIEANVIDWLARTFDLPEGATGVLASGGSLANLGAMVAARQALGDDLRTGTLYVSEQAHHSVAKAARIAGLPPGAVRAVPCDERLRLDPDALERMLAADRAAGRRPFMVVGTAGTTNTGAVDPLPALAGICEREGLWLHADAAYGGFFQLTERGRACLAGIERADSITLDPHKGMFLPYGTGCLLVRDGERLRAAHAGEAHYLQDADRGRPLPDFADMSPELSRNDRGLRVWLPLQLHGVGAFRRALDEKLDLARLAWERLADVAALELPWEPELSIVAFRLREGDDRALLERINASGRIFISSTTIGGRVMLRLCVLCHRTHRERVEEAIEIVAEAATAEAGRRRRRAR